MSKTLCSVAGGCPAEGELWQPLGGAARKTWSRSVQLPIGEWGAPDLPMYRGNGDNNIMIKGTFIFYFLWCLSSTFLSNFAVSDNKRVHSRHGPGHLECVPHSEQQSTLCLLRNSPAALQTPSRAYRQCSHLHSHEPTGCNEGPEGGVQFSSDLNSKSTIYWKQTQYDQV